MSSIAHAATPGRIQRLIDDHAIRDITTDTRIVPVIPLNVSTPGWCSARNVPGWLGGLSEADDVLVTVPDRELHHAVRLQNWLIHESGISSAHLVGEGPGIADPEKCIPRRSLAVCRDDALRIVDPAK